MQDTDQNLLDGVMMTTSVSCPNPDHSYTLDAYEGHSLTAQLQEEFKLSSNEDENDRPFLKELTEQHTELELNAFSQPKRKIMQKQQDKHGRSGAKIAQGVKSRADKKWEKLIDMDSKLVETHISGLLDSSDQSLNKVGQLILTEQYCRLKAYESHFLTNLKQIDFSLSESEKQKKTLLSHINLLKNDNDMLQNTVDELYKIIHDLEALLQTHIKESKQKTSKKATNSLYTESNMPKEENALSMSQGQPEVLLINSGLEPVFSELTFGRSHLKPLSQHLKLIQQFVDSFETHKLKFVQNIQSSPNKELEFWFVTHTTIFTFLELMISQNNPSCSLDDYDQSFSFYQEKLIENLSQVKHLSHVELEDPKVRYWNRAIAFIRMFRSRQ